MKTTSLLSRFLPIVPPETLTSNKAGTEWSWNPVPMKKLEGNSFLLDSTWIIVLRAGQVRFSIGLKEYDASAPSLIVLLSSSCICLIESGDKVDAGLLSLSDDFFSTLNLPNTIGTFFAVNASPVIELTPATLGPVENYRAMVHAMFSEKDHPRQMDVVRHLTTAFYLAIGYYFHKPSSSGQDSRKGHVTKEFMNLIEDHFKEHGDLAFYSGKLCMTSKYLSACVKDVTGRPALFWIKRQMILYAKSRLSDPTALIGDIGGELGFGAVSEFSRFFRKEEGKGPREYRKEVQDRLFFSQEG